MSASTVSLPISAFKQIPAGWQETTLGEIGDYINGRGFKKSEWAREGLPIVRIQDLTGTGKERNFYQGNIEERHVIEPGELLISWSATLGAFIWNGPKAALNQHIFKVESRVDKKFHYYLIKFILDDLYRQTHGSGMVHITKGKFEAIRIGIPETKQEQQRIVAEIEKQFSRLDKAAASLKRVKANLKRYKAAVLKAAVEGNLTEEWRKQNPDVESASELLERILVERRAKWEEAELAKMMAKGKDPKDHEWKYKYNAPTEVNVNGLLELPDGWQYLHMECFIDEPKYGTSKKCNYNQGSIGVLRIPNIVKGKIDDRDLKFAEFDDKETDVYKLQEGDL